MYERFNASERIVSLLKETNYCILLRMIDMSLHIDSQAPQPCNIDNSKEYKTVSIYSKHSRVYYHLPHSIQLTGPKKKLNFMYHLLLSRVSQEMIVWRECTYLGTHIQMEKVSKI